MRVRWSPVLLFGWVAGCGGGVGECSAQTACGGDECPETVDDASALCDEAERSVRACESGTIVQCHGYVSRSWSFDDAGRLVATWFQGEDALPVSCGSDRAVGACPVIDR